MTGRGPVLLQVCNVGRVTGGTGACAWTITRALAGWRHLVVFPGRIDDETRRTFAPVPVVTWPRIDEALVRAVGAEVVLLHNTGPGRVAGPLSAVTIQYGHSPGARADGDLRVYCSRHLARLCGGEEHEVLYQPVPEPPRSGETNPSETGGKRSRLGESLVVGRLCTPTDAKWPESLVERYAEWSRAVPEARWEFVGCPDRLQHDLRRACGGRTRFTPASWEARSRLRAWDVLLYHHPEITETFGRVVAEALRAGCVPVVDNRGGFVEQITPETGFLCDSSGSFEEALQRLSDPHVRWRMGEAGRLRGRIEFGEAAFARRFVARVRQAARRVSEEALPEAAGSVGRALVSP